MEEISNIILTILYLYNLVYAFIYWGIGWGIVNLFFPVAVIADLVRKIGRF